MMEAEDKKLLKKFLEGKCTDEEILWVNILLQRPQAKAILDELLLEQNVNEWNAPVDADPAMLQRLAFRRSQVQQRIKAEQGQASIPNYKDHPVRRLNFLRYAAVWAGVIMVAGFMIWQFAGKDKTEQLVFIKKTNTNPLPQRYMLPDSSEIFLGTGGSLKYAANFNTEEKREIQLQGEAFFQVKHDPAKPFIIHTGEINTQVLGTSFKVQAYSGQPLVVSVATGKVGVSKVDVQQSKTLALLTPGQKITWNSKTGKYVKGTVDVYNLMQWKSGELVFDELEFIQAANALKDRYHVQIKFMDKDVQDYQVSGTFSPNVPVEKVLKMLSILGKFRYESTDNKSFKIYKTE